MLIMNSTKIIVVSQYWFECEPLFNYLICNSVTLKMLTTKTVTQCTLGYPICQQKRPN